MTNEDSNNDKPEISSDASETCIFCKIVAGEIPCSKVAETDRFLVFLDISPCNKGHALIIPKKHYVRCDEFSEEMGKEFGELQIQLGKAVVKASGADGFNLLMNNGKAADQEVMHAHMHVQPRFDSDEFHYKWIHTSYDDGEMEQMKEKIIDSLSNN